MKKYLYILIFFLLLITLLSITYFLNNNDSDIKQDDITYQKDNNKTSNEYNIDDLNDYFVSVGYDSFVDMNWNNPSIEEDEVLIVNLEGNNKEVVFLYRPDDYRIGSNCENIQSGPARDISNKYGFYFRPSILSSNPMNYGDNYFAEIMCVPKTCANSIDLDKDCICSEVKNELDKNIKSRFDAVIDGNLSWVTDEIRSEFQIAENDYKTMEMQCGKRSVKVASYSNNSGILKVALDLDENIIGIIQFAPLLY